MGPCDHFAWQKAKEKGKGKTGWMDRWGAGLMDCWPVAFL
jgi:hypothetical protein